MSGEGLANNPFAALFPNLSSAETFSASYKLESISKHLVEESKQGHDSEQSADAAPDPTPNSDVNRVINTTHDGEAVNNFIERVFLISLNAEPSHHDRPGKCVLLEELSAALKGQVTLDWEILSQAVFERLMLSEPGDNVITTNPIAVTPQVTKLAEESEILRYLSSAFCRLQHEKQERKNVALDWVAQCESVIITDARMFLQHPEVFGDVNATQQFMNVYMDLINDRDGDIICELFERVTVDIEVNQEEGSLEDVFRPVLDNVKQVATMEFSLGNNVIFRYLDLFMFFTRTSSLAELFLSCNQPQDLNNGASYEHTILGSVLAVSCVVKNEAGPYQFFDKPSRYSKQEHDITESNIHQPIASLNERVYQFIFAMLKLSGEPRHRMLEWLGNCLHANTGRAKMWSHHMPILGLYAYDGFWVNLCAVLLRLCKPFCQANSSKILKIQATYCQATDGDKATLRDRNVHMRELGEETCLIPVPEGEQCPPVETSYNFISECFFLTHHCIHIGLHVVHEKFLKLNQELHRIQSLYSDIVQGGGESSQMGQRIKNEMEKGMTFFLCMKAALTEPQLLDLCFSFHVTTANFLVHQATAPDLGHLSPVSFPLPDRGPIVLACIPEFTAENIMDYMLFLRRFKDMLYEVEGERLNNLMTLILVFMGSPSHMRNPHMRARLAEALEALMPPKTNQASLFVHYYRQQLFESHQYIDQLASILLHVFVSIEMTGQGVQFEQKFNYRRPMYTILEYIWNIDRHKQAIKHLSELAESNTEAAEAPLFLRFINLLINDAIFLLDEALQYMSQIKEKQEEQDAGTWNELPANQRQENEANLRQLTMLARFHNLMGNDTIHSLELITQEIKSIFVHDIMVDRVASMLNYFLLHLVGPKKKSLKVKDFDKYDFKPQDLVASISRIYVNLGDCDSFCLAVSRDGRSYSHELFLQATNVLNKIRQPVELITQFTAIGEKCQELATRQAMEDEAVSDAPEEFLDAILGTLMKDPVLLPSGKVVDRSTIARHILSDQTDPFNRQPLTMDQVNSADDLKEKIQKWLQQHRHSSS